MNLLVKINKHLQLANVEMFNKFDEIKKKCSIFIL